MTDREQAIKDLENIIAISDKFKEDGIWAGLITINADKIKSLKFALESLKADASDKTDRGEVIATLTEHLDHWKRLLSEGICCEVEGKQTIDALEFAIESIKVDRAYDLAYEKVDFIEIPEGATFGNMIMAVLSDMPNVKINENFGRIWVVQNGEDIANFKWSLWNSPYRKEQE